MPTQRRPPPPPPPDGDSIPPPLPNRPGATPRVPQPTEEAAPPLPGRNVQNGSGPNPPALPARPPQSPQEKLMQGQNNTTASACDDVYLMPTEGEDPQSIYDEMDDPFQIPHDLKRGNSRQTQPGVDLVQDETYEMPTEIPPRLPDTGQPHGTHSHRVGEDDDFSDGEAWPDEFEDDDAARDETNGGNQSPDAGLYLTPDSEAVADSTYEAPDTGFDQAPPKFAPTLKPAKAQRNTSSSSDAGVAKPKGFLSISDRMKMFQGGSNAPNVGKAPAPPQKPKPNSNTPTPLTPNNSQHPKSDQFATSSTKPSLPVKPQAGSSANTPLASNRQMPTKPTALSRAGPPPLPTKPTGNAPPALPPNHPTQDGRSDDSGSAGSISSGSGGVINTGFISELSKVIASAPCPRNAPQNQVTGKLQNTAISNGTGDIYTDGVTEVEPVHPLSIHPWFHEDASRQDGDQRVLRVAQEGAFLVRKSSQNNSYTLVVYSGNETFNLPISLRQDGKYAIGKEKRDEKRFDSVDDFIAHHLQFNINLSKGGSVKLSKPVPRPK